MRKNYKPKEIIVAGTKFDIVYRTMKDFGELDFDERKHNMNSFMNYCI